jgi:uncharacterized membrane protein
VELSETGLSRLNGYLFVLRRSLEPSLPRDVADDAVREIESHLRDRIAAAPPAADERRALEGILMRLGTPARVAQAYRVERAVDEALLSGRVLSMLRAVWHVARTGLQGFLAGFALVSGYAIGTILLVLAVLKPVFPDNIGFWVSDVSFVKGFDISWRGGIGPGVRNEHLVGGYWFIPIALVAGVALLVLMRRGLRSYLRWARSRLPLIPSQEWNLL